MPFRHPGRDRAFRGHLNTRKYLFVRRTVHGRGDLWSFGRGVSVATGVKFCYNKAQNTMSRAVPDEKGPARRSKGGIT